VFVLLLAIVFSHGWRIRAGFRLNFERHDLNCMPGSPNCDPDNRDGSDIACGTGEFGVPECDSGNNSGDEDRNDFEDRSDFAGPEWDDTVPEDRRDPRHMFGGEDGGFGGHSSPNNGNNCMPGSPNCDPDNFHNRRDPRHMFGGDDVAADQYPENNADNCMPGSPACDHENSGNMEPNYDYGYGYDDPQYSEGCHWDEIGGAVISFVFHVCVFVGVFFLIRAMVRRCCCSGRCGGGNCHGNCHGNGQGNQNVSVVVQSAGVEAIEIRRNDVEQPLLFATNEDSDASFRYGQ